MVHIKRYKHAKLKNEIGFTLIEVLSSIVILTIIITIFLNVFIQSSQTNRTSGEIIDATYFAQTEMERIYEKSLGESYSNREATFTDMGYQTYAFDEIWITFKKEISPGYYMKVKLQNKSIEGADHMNRVIVTIHKGTVEGSRLALMENIIVWGADSE